jgi:Uma2 family endonuclease
MLKYIEPLDWLPTAEDLPDSDEMPVDNELQELAPTLLKLILSMVWADRTDWFMGIAIATSGQSAKGIRHRSRGGLIAHRGSFAPRISRTFQTAIG